MTPSTPKKSFPLPGALDVTVPPGHVVTVQSVEDDGRPTGEAPEVYVPDKPGDFEFLMVPDVPRVVDVHVVRVRAQPRGDARAAHPQTLN